MMSRRIVCQLGMLFLSLHALHAQAQNALTPQEIQSTWVGKTLTAIIGSGPMTGKELVFRMQADGTSTLQGALQDTGAWRLSDNGYCNSWKKIRSGAERCFTVIRKDREFLILNPDGSLNTTVIRVE